LSSGVHRLANSEDDEDEIVEDDADVDKVEDVPDGDDKLEGEESDRSSVDLSRVSPTPRPTRRPITTAKATKLEIM